MWLSITNQKITQMLVTNNKFIELFDYTKFD